MSTIQNALIEIHQYWPIIGNHLFILMILVVDIALNRRAFISWINSALLLMVIFAYIKDYNLFGVGLVAVIIVLFTLVKIAVRWAFSPAVR